MNALLAYWQQQGRNGSALGNSGAAGHPAQPTEQQAAVLAKIETAYSQELFSPPLWSG